LHQGPGTAPSRREARPLYSEKAMVDSTLEGETVTGASLRIKAGEVAITSAWVPLRQKVFRTLWIAAVASNIGTWMHEVGASWLMTQLAPSPLTVSLIQTAEAAPVFLLALAAGALADVVDRRRLLIFSQSWMLASAAGLGLLTVLRLTTPHLLLAFTFLLSFGGALNGPAWQAIVPELVPRAELPAAVSLNSVGFNVARAAGPALGGLVVAAAGSGAVFLLNAVSFLGVIVVLYHWRRAPGKSALPAERVLGAMRSGLRYVMHAPPIHSVLIRLSLFMLGASALWSLVPLFARQNLGRGAAGYGVLLGFFGAGAVIGGSFLPRVRLELGIQRLLGAATILFASALALMALWRYFPVGCAAMFAAGFAWTSELSTFNTSIQLNTPAWVRGRALAVYQLTYFAGLGAYSALWGTVALHVGVARALLIAALALGGSLTLAARFQVGLGEGLDLAPSSRPVPVVVNEPDVERGPVLVTVEYQIDPRRAAEFTAAMLDLGRVRRRDGAMRWGLFEDVAAPGRYLETFVVESWVEHLRQHGRATVADRQVWERVRSFHLKEGPPAVAHLLYAYHEEH
jgi:MFS family permease